MKRTITLIVLISCFVCGLVRLEAQQDPMYTKYMFNGLAYNPAFAGSPGYMSARLLYRKQWWAFEGAPETQSFSIHTPAMERVGVGLNVVNDKIGATGTTSLYTSYAYRIPFGKGKLSLGLQAGVMNWRADWNKLTFKDPREQDEAFAEAYPNFWLPNFGAGVFYTAPQFYLGFSVPHLINHDLRKDVSDAADLWAKQYRHFFFSAGGTFDLNGEALVFKPSMLIKSVGLLGNFSSDPSRAGEVSAPVEFDVDLSLMFYEAFWLGVSFRSAFQAKQFGGASSFDSADFWAAFYLQNGLRIGVAYDYTLTALQSYAKGSLEVMLGYDFSYKNKKIITPRYF